MIYGWLDHVLIDRIMLWSIGTYHYPIIILRMYFNFLSPKSYFDWLATLHIDFSSKYIAHTALTWFSYCLITLRSLWPKVYLCHVYAASTFDWCFEFICLSGCPDLLSIAQAWAMKNLIRSFEKLISCNTKVSSKNISNIPIRPTYLVSGLTCLIFGLLGFPALT